METPLRGIRRALSQKILNFGIDLAQGEIEQECKARSGQFILLTVQGLCAPLQPGMQCRSVVKEPTRLGGGGIHRGSLSPSSSSMPRFGGDGAS